MGDPVGFYAQNYQGYGPSSNAQYQGPPQPRYPPSAALDPPVYLGPATSTQYQASVPCHYAQPPQLSAIAPESYSGHVASSAIHYQLHPNPLGSRPGITIQPPQQEKPPVPTIQPPIQVNYGGRQHFEWTSPPNSHLGLYKPDYRNFAPPAPTYPPVRSSYSQSSYHATPRGHISPPITSLNPVLSKAPSPLTIEPSLTALLRSTVKMILYLRDVKNGSNNSKKLLLALLTTRGLVDTLLETIQEIEDSRDWALTVNLLRQKENPIIALISILDKMHADLAKNIQWSPIKKCTKWLFWSISSTETEGILESINSQSALLLIALENDHVLLTSEISRKNLTSHGGARDNVLTSQGPNDSQPGLEPNDLASLLSGMNIHSHPTPITSSQPVIVPPRDDGIEWVVHEILRPDLEAGQITEKIRPDHPCFNESREFARRWSIPNQAVDNHIKLASGYTKFPVILLLNPSPDHHRSTFDDMVRKCPTLFWIQGVLQELELQLEDVIILDICTLLDKNFLDRKSVSDRFQAINDAYEVTHRMLKMIKPKIIVSCQCSTYSEEWGNGSHVVARDLCSSVAGASKGISKSTYILGPNPVYVIQGHHPRYFLGRDGSRARNEEVLRSILHRVFRPCGQELKRIQPSSLAAGSFGALLREPFDYTY